MSIKPTEWHILIWALLISVSCSPGASAQSVTTGSGFFIDPTHIVTCAHCVADSSRITIVFGDGSKSNGKVLFADEELDVAVIKSDKQSPDSLGFGDSESLKLLDDLFVFGFPLASELGSELSATQGKLNSRRNMGGEQWLQLDATINPGNSGGPVLNSSGQVVGIAVARLDPLKMAKEIGTIPERINFAIPSSIVRLRLARSNLNTPVLQPTAPVTDMASYAAKATVLVISVGKIPEGMATAQPPLQPPPNQEAAMTRAAADYVASGNSPALDGEMEPYADRVDYYDQGIKNLDEIRADIAGQRSRCGLTPKNWT